MKRNYALVWILMALCIVFCACDGVKMSPWGEKTTQNHDGTAKFNAVYVCGAVQNEGYYTVSEGAIYLDAIAQAGLLNCSSIPSYAYTVVRKQTLVVIVNYVENGVVHDSINVNDAYVLRRLPVDGISYEVVCKIADYVEAFGAISNKQVLRTVLGKEDYENYHYKLYIAEADYEAVH